MSRWTSSTFSGENGKSVDTYDWILGERFTSMFLVVNSPDFEGSSFDNATVYFSHAAANSNGHQHIKMLGNNTFGFEDSAGLGDQDYNDIVVQFSVAQV